MLFLNFFFFFNKNNNHFYRRGSWRSGGNCHQETLPNLGSSPEQPSTTSPQYHIFKDIISNSSKNSSMNVLNTTIMSARRKDGHPSLYYLGPMMSPAAVHRQDCSHWCLPGVPDAWNEILYAFVLKQAAVSGWYWFSGDRKEVEWSVYMVSDYYTNAFWRWWCLEFWHGDEEML